MNMDDSVLVERAVLTQWSLPMFGKCLKHMFMGGMVTSTEDSC